MFLSCEQLAFIEEIVQYFIGQIGGFFGNHAHYIEDESESQTTSTDYVHKVSLTTSALPDANYRIGWKADMMSSNGSSKTVGLKVELDGATIIDEVVCSDLRLEWQEMSGFRHLNIGAGSHTISMYFRNVATPQNTAYIRRSRIELWRVS